MKDKLDNFDHDKRVMEEKLKAEIAKKDQDAKEERDRLLAKAREEADILKREKIAEADA